MSDETRPVPWTELVEALGDGRFREVHEDLERRGTDDLDRDAFLLSGTVSNLLKDLFPGDAPAESVTAYGALLHALYACWARGWPVVRADAEALRSALADPPSPVPSPHRADACYVQLPPNLVWSQSGPGASHEPLDGAFLVLLADRVQVLAVLGFRPGREGFTTMEAAMRLPADLPGPREDGTARFASVLPAGDRAGLVSVVDTHELAVLAVLALGAAR